MMAGRLGSRALVAGAVTAGVLLGGLSASTAWAIPPGGPGADTPGTSSSVSPSRLAPCQTISYTVTGFPGGETLYIKIDDGIGYGDTSVQGSGVISMQAIPASGTVHGSLELPCDIAPGGHWLRFLASQYVDANDPGKGVLGFTNRGGSDFTVVAGGGGGTGGGGGGRGSAGLGGSAPAAGETVGSGAEQVSGQGGVLGIDPNAVEQPTPTPTPSETKRKHTPEPIVLATDERDADTGAPVVGLIGGGALVLAGAAAAAFLLARRRGTTPSA